MRSRLLSLVLLGAAALRPAGSLPTGYGEAFTFLAVVHFWWTHAFRIRRIDWRFLFLFSGLALGSWLLLNGAGFTGIPEDPDFNPGQIAALKRSRRVALRLYFDHPPSPEERYLRLGLEGPLPRGGEDRVARLWAGKHLTGLPLERKLSNLENWFRSSFRYSLESGWKGLDPFLFETRTGYCVHFSGAAAALLGFSGTQAQIVYGYSGGSWNPITRILTYRDEDAHTWLEIGVPDPPRVLRVDPTLWIAQSSPGNSGEVDPDLLSGASLRILFPLLLFLATLFLILFLATGLRGPREQLLRLFPRPTHESLPRRIRHPDRTGPARGALLAGIAGDYATAIFSRSPRFRDRIRLQYRISRLRLLRLRDFFLPHRERKNPSSRSR